MSTSPVPSPASPTANHRIRRNTACTSCRDSKVKCNASLRPGQSCQRCTKLGLQCVVDKSHKRVSRRSKLEELVQEVQSIKQAVSPRTYNAPPPLVYPPQQRPLPPAPCPTRPETAARVSTIQHPLTPSESLDITNNRTIIPRIDTFPPELTNTAAPSPSVCSRPPEPRALASRVFSSEDIEFYFTKYFQHFHPYFPIVQIRDPDECYKDCSLLFWVIILTSCRRYRRDPHVFDFLVEAVAPEIWAPISKPPLFVNTINALLLICAWPLPNIRFIRDPSFMLVSVAMGACYATGLHTGRGVHPEYNYPRCNKITTDEEAVHTWAGYNIMAQRIASYSGFPSTGPLFNKTIEGVLNQTNPIQIPKHLRVLLETARFSQHVNKAMSANLEDTRGVSHHIVSMFEEEFDKTIRVLHPDDSDLDHFILLCTLLDVQSYYFIPLAGYNPETHKRNILKAYSTAEALVQKARELHKDHGFLSFAPHFVARSLLAAISVVISVLLSSYMKDVALDSRDSVVRDAIEACKATSLQEGDLALRATSMMESYWNIKRQLPPEDLAEMGISGFSHRLGMSLTYDVIRAFKREIETTLPASYNSNGHNINADPAIANAIAAATAAGPSGAGGASGAVAGMGGGLAATGTGGGAGTTPGGGTSLDALAAAATDPPGAATATMVDPFMRIDWDAFMEDFDWSFPQDYINTAAVSGPMAKLV